MRVWMCGGSIEIIPCSIVGHVFPQHGFYDRRSVVPNTMRVVEVWLDKTSKRFYYQRNVDGEWGTVGDLLLRCILNYYQRHPTHYLVVL